MPETTKPKLVPPADPNKRRVYWLNRMERQLDDGTTVLLTPSPEVIAVALAKCSRTDTPFDQNVYEATEAKASEFHEKWVVGYGHGSVAEHAVPSVALENVSQVVIKIIEDCRLCSFTEKSSRYQIFSAVRCVTPAKIAASHLRHAYTGTVEGLYSLYEEALRRLDGYMREKFPNETGISDRAYAAQIKGRSCDVARYLLPSAAMASFGVTANARNWATIITKLMSSPHDEAHEVGRELIEALHGGPDADPEVAILTKPIHTLLKYAGRNEYRSSLPDTLHELANDLLQDVPVSGPVADNLNPVVLLADDPFAELHIAAALLAGYSDRPYAEILSTLKGEGSLDIIDRVISTALRDRGPHDPAPRPFEDSTFTHEIVIDYGAWRDIQRHRICSPLNQTLGVELGYDVPQEITDIGLADDFHALMTRVKELHKQLVAAGLEVEAEYAVPMAFRRRLIVSWNVRELFHFIELRSGSKGHPSYRRIAQEVWRTVNETHTLIAKHIRVDMSAATTSTLGAKPKGF